MSELKEKSKIVALTELQDVAAPKGNKVIGVDYSAVSDVKVHLEAFIGTASITIQELFDLELGSTVSLNESVDSLILLKLDGKSVAQGTLVVVGDTFGIKITDIVKTNTKN
ncbi:flagellar motor switch/type III secretory pathway protein [Methylophilaceae bacterium 11]|nr:flagellar motor switch/type III secretory pathway protein [Methylophilaceae bacterium 11]